MTLTPDLTSFYCQQLMYEFSKLLSKGKVLSLVKSRYNRESKTFLCTSDKVGFFSNKKQKRSTEGCSKFKSPETRQVQERLVSTLEHMQVPKWDRTRCPEE